MCLQRTATWNGERMRRLTVSSVLPVSCQISETFFIKTLDDSPTGIRMMMLRLHSELERTDTAVFNVFEAQGIKMQYFAFRWLSLMLSQEFPLPDVLILWDALLTDDTRFV